MTALELLGECTILIDCDVLQADGGTRTASITGGYLALAQARERACGRPVDAGGSSLRRRAWPRSAPASSATSRCSTSATRRTRRAEVDFNVVMTGAGRLSRCRGRPRGSRSSRAQLDELVTWPRGGIERLIEFQR